jgi:intraflagellar transport protein 122
MLVAGSWDSKLSIYQI